MLNKLGKKKKNNFKIILETTKTLNIYIKNVRVLRWKNNKKKQKIILGQKNVMIWGLRFKVLGNF